MADAISPNRRDGYPIVRSADQTIAAATPRRDFAADWLQMAKRVITDTQFQIAARGSRAWRIDGDFKVMHCQNWIWRGGTCFENSWG